MLTAMKIIKMFSIPNPSEAVCNEALVGSSNALKKQYTKTFPSRQRQFHTSPFFRPVRVLSDADWLLNHKETGQTFESFWRENVAVGFRTQAEKPHRPQTALGFRPKQSDTIDQNSKLIYIQPIGKFPAAKQVGQFHPFIIWLQTFSAAFFQNAEVRILPAVEIEEVKCSYRVNELTGRFQLNATNIISYFKKNKPKNCHCLMGVTMTDLYPKSSWDFVFGLASAANGVGVFSFARFEDLFYETWTQGEDSMCRNDDGTLDYSPFKKEYSGGAGGSEIKAILLFRACKVMCHEICHMLGLKHCFYYECLMNGSNHLQESDRRPPFLCPVCSRKLQAVLQFDTLTWYKAMLKWTDTEFWKSYLHKEVKSGRTIETRLRLPWERCTSLLKTSRPQTSTPKKTIKSQSSFMQPQLSVTRIRPKSSRPLTSRPQTAKSSISRPFSSKLSQSARSTGKMLSNGFIENPQTKTQNKSNMNTLASNGKNTSALPAQPKGLSVPIPPLEAFDYYKKWLTEAIEFLESK